MVQKAARLSQAHTIASHADTHSSNSSVRTDSVQGVHIEPIREDPLASVDDEHGYPLSRKATSIRTNATSDPRFEVDWEADDKENPRNWSLAYKCWVLFVMSYSTFTVVLYSTAYTAAIYDIQAAFDEPNEIIATLGLTTYLIGIAVGSLIVAPLSELYGRKWIYVISTALFCVLLIPAGLATNLPGLIVLRFFIALMASADIANTPGTIADVISEDYRALAFSIWAIAPMNGPTFGPIIGGFVAQYLGWRWEQWLCLIMAGVALAMLFTTKESYGPVLLQRRAAKLRKETGDKRYWSRYDSKLAIGALLRLNLIRPFVMAVTEPICMFWNLYIAVIYGILYLAFVAYPIVFTGYRGWSTGITGLAFLGIGAGTMMVICSEPLIRRYINSHKPDPETGKAPLEAMMGVVCLASILVPIGQFWFSWTCVRPVHFIVPILAGIPFGAGNAIVFIYATNYLARAYGIYAASAMAGNAVIRSFLGGALPLAGPSMYATLGPHWAGSLLGFLQIMIIPIPFIFWKYGAKIRAKSALIRQMREEEDRQEAKKLKGQERLARKNGGDGLDLEKASHRLESEEVLREKNIERGLEGVEEAGMAGVEARSLDLDREAVEVEKEIEGNKKRSHG